MKTRVAEKPITLAGLVGDIRQEYDGHITIFAFTTGWKAFGGTIDADRKYSAVYQTPEFPTMREAVEALWDAHFTVVVA